MVVATWILAIAGLVGTAVTVYVLIYRSGGSDASVRARLSAVESAVKTMAENVTQISTSQARLDQRMHDHEVRDEQRFGDITEAFQTVDRKIDELPQKIKDLLSK